MKKFLTSFVIIFILPLGFNGFFSIGNNSFLKTFPVNYAFAVENKEYQENEDIKPWESFRGWAPSIPYNNNYKPNFEVETTKNRDEKNLLKEDAAKPTQSEKDPVEKEEVVKPWEAFRGWAPSVPYQ